MDTTQTTKYEYEHQRRETQKDALRALEAVIPSHHVLYELRSDNHYTPTARKMMEAVEYIKTLQSQSDAAFESLKEQDTRDQMANRERQEVQALRREAQDLRTQVEQLEEEKERLNQELTRSEAANQKLEAEIEHNVKLIKAAVGNLKATKFE